MMTAFVLNPVSLGAQLVSLTGDATQAEATITGWRPPEMLDVLGLSLADLDPWWEALRVMPQYLGYHYTWTRNDTTVTFRLTQAARHLPSP